MASNTLPVTEVKNVPIANNISAAPLCTLCFCDSVIYNTIMHVVIIGTVLPLFYHLQNDNDYFSTVALLIVVQLMTAFVQFGCVEGWSEALAFGSLSHVFGVIAIYLLLRQISPVLAMSTCIPALVWLGVTLIYHIGSFCCGALEQSLEYNVEARRDAADLV